MILTPHCEGIIIIIQSLTQPAFTYSKLTIEKLEQRCEICSKLTIKHISHPCSTVSIVNFEHVNASWDVAVTEKIQ